MSPISRDPISIEEARKRTGLRLLLLQGLPSPWSQAAKGIFHVKGIDKGIDYALAHGSESDPPGILEEWTGQASYPVAMFDDEQPFRSQCTALSPVFATWQELVSYKGTLFVLDQVRARKNVRLEVRGYHNIIENDPCENPSDEWLMLWGTSDVVDLTSADTTNTTGTTPDRQKGIPFEALRRRPV